MEGSLTPHRIVNPESLAPPQGFAHAVVAARGRTLYLGGQVASDTRGRIVGDSVTAQFEIAAANVAKAMRAAGAEPSHLVSLHIFVTDVQAYRESLSSIGDAYRSHFGAHYPAIALFEVARLFDPDALVELVGIAVVPGSAE
ncbi:MAG: RidA family protein [Actinomycetota bacterium]|nr:RidA family protein [Actinomycetota bacterium]